MLTVKNYLAKLSNMRPTLRVARDARTRASYDARARIMKALAHPTRLFLAETLSRGRRCVCDLADLAGADVSIVSRHLAQLRGAGLVRSEKRGLQVFYEMTTPCLLGFLECAETALETQVREQARVAGLAAPRRLRRA